MNSSSTQQGNVNAVNDVNVAGAVVLFYVEN